MPSTLLRACERCGQSFHAHRYGNSIRPVQWTRFCSLKCSNSGTRGPNKGTVAWHAMYYLYQAHPEGLTTRDLATLLNRRPGDVSHYLWTHRQSHPPIFRVGGEDAPGAPIMLRYFLTESGQAIAHKRFGTALRQVKGALCEGLD